MRDQGHSLHQARFSPGGEIAAVLLTAFWLLMVRTAMECPWGLRPAMFDGGVETGILYNANDTWTYLSWIRQYQDGAWGAELLYTTEPHPALLWLFPLWLVGRVSAATGLNPIGVFNVAGFTGALVAVFCFRRATRALGFSPSQGNWATVVLVLGSGSSWIWHAAHLANLAPPATGADLGYFDLFPSATIHIYAYHSLGLALLTALWWFTIKCETAVLREGVWNRWLPATVGCALLLGFSRPYEPAAFLAAYGLKSAWVWSQRHRDPGTWRTCRFMISVLASTLGAGLAWNAYVAVQPIWSTFAGHSLSLGKNRIDWLAGFGGLWLAAGLGVRPLFRLGARMALLPCAAAILMLVVLLVLDLDQSKLVSGLSVGLALMAGLGLHRVAAWCQARMHPVAATALGALLVGGLIGTGSLFLNLRSLRLKRPPPMDAGLWQAAAAIPKLTGSRVTTVLTDALTGNALPGLRGVRVWAGHLALTHRYAEKLEILRAAGIDPHCPSEPEVIGDRLQRLLAEVHFDYALLDRHCEESIGMLLRRGWAVVKSSHDWRVLRAPGEPPSEVSLASPTPP